MSIKKTKITVLANDLYQFLHIYKFASTDTFRSHLSRVLIDVSCNHLTFVATNGHVMAVAKMRVRNASSSAIFCLPIEHIKSLMQYIKSYMGDGYTIVEISITGKHVVVEVENSNMKIYFKKHTTDDFPEYRKAMVPRDRKNDGGGNKTALQPAYLSVISKFFSLFEHSIAKRMRINYGYGKEPTLFYADLPEDGTSLDVIVMPKID